MVLFQSCLLLVSLSTLCLHSIDSRVCFFCGPLPVLKPPAWCRSTSVLVVQWYDLHVFKKPYSSPSDHLHGTLHENLPVSISQSARQYKISTEAGFAMSAALPTSEINSVNATFLVTSSKTSKHTKQQEEQVLKRSIFTILRRHFTVICPT